MPRKKQHYVDNEKFLEVMPGYRIAYLESKENDEEKPMIPDYAGECFLKIAERLSHRQNFINYAFLRRIEKEKKQLYIKYKTMDEFSSLEDNSDMDSVSDESAISSGASPLSADKRASIYDFIATFEEKKRARKELNQNQKRMII